MCVSLSHTQTHVHFNTPRQSLRRHILNTNACGEETDGGTDEQMDGWIESGKGTAEKSLVIGCDGSGRHRGEIKGGKEERMEGMERELKYGGMARRRREAYLSLCNPPDSSQRQRRKRERERTER